MVDRVRFQKAVIDHSVVTLRKMEDYINAGMETTVDMADDIVQHEKEKNCTKAEDLKTVMQEYCQMERDLGHFLTVVDQVKEQALAHRGEDMPDLVKMLDSKVEEIALSAGDIDFANHEKYKDLLEKINSIGAEEEGNTEEAEEGAEMGDSEEITVTQQMVNTKCPYTGLEMQHPVKNAHCGHTYDREGITEFIKSRGRRAKCPVSGCVNQVVLSKSDLTENKEVKKYIEKLKKSRAAGKLPSRK